MTIFHFFDLFVLIDSPSLLKSIITRTWAIVQPLSIAAFSSLSLAYFAASPSGKHPYLLYTAFSIPISFAVAYFRGLPVYASLTNLLDSRASADAALKSAEPSEEPKQNIDGSVYNITNSDLEAGDEEKSPKPKTAGSDNDTTESVDSLISDHVARLIKYGRIITAVTSTAFLMVTVGIYGEFK